LLVRSKHDIPVVTDCILQSTRYQAMPSCLPAIFLCRIVGSQKDDSRTPDR